MTDSSSSLAPPGTDDPQGELREVRLPYATSRSIIALMLREMSTSYGRSPGGYVWAVLEPIAGIALLTLIFSTGFRHPPLGTSFPLFYATGILPFMMYMDIATKLSQTLNFSRALLEYPRVTFVDALLARLLLNLITQLMVSVVILTGVITFFAGDVAFDAPKMAIAYGIAIALAMGVGVLNCFLSTAYPIWGTAWAVMNRPLFLISCVFFLFDTVPQPYRDMLWYNPLIHPVGIMRDAFYPYYHPNYVSVVYPLMISCVLIVAGLFLLSRYHRDILDK